MDYKVASEKLRAFAATLVEPDESQGETADRLIAVSLQQAAFDAVRDGWQHLVDANPELKRRVAIARVMMDDAGYQDMDPICSPPGVKPMIAKVSNLECVAWDYSLSTTTPLSAMFTNIVCEVLDAAEKVATADKAAAEASSDGRPTEQAKPEGINVDSSNA
jgi:hypothetical protein